MNDRKSAQGTIEDKLNQILKREQTYVQQCTLANINAAKTSGQWIIHDPNRAEALREIQAIITTETTKAKQEAWNDCALHIAMQHYMLSAQDFKKIMFATRSELGSKKADTERSDMVATDSGQAEATQSRQGVQKEQKR